MILGSLKVVQGTLSTVSLNVPDVAARQAGAFSRAQALATGISKDRIRRNLERGLWVVVAGRVYAASPVRVDEWTRAWASYLLCAGVVSHTTAAALFGMGVNSSAIESTLPVTSRRRDPGIRIHRVPLPESDVVTWRGLRVTAAARTVFDCLCVLPIQPARDLAFRAIQRRWITRDELASRVRAGMGRHGVPQVRDLLRELTTDAHSAAEAVLHRLLRAAGIRGWAANVAVHDLHGLVGVVDVLFPEIRLVIEVDGRAYHGADRFQYDRTRQNRLVRAGYTVLRFTWEDLTKRPDYVLATVRSALVRLAA